MKHFLTTIGRFFCSWHFLKTVLWTMTILVLFYVEEDWRGARLWAATKQKWESRGETFDFQKFVLPPVPDSENVGALPLFQVRQVEGENGQNSYQTPTRLHEALRMDSFDRNESDLPMGHWYLGELPEPGKLHVAVTARYAKVFRQQPPSPDPRIQFESLYPFLPNLRRAALERPFCRFAFDDTQALPAARGLELITGQMALSRLITLHALLALEDHETDVALDDYATVLKLRLGAERDPSLVGALVSAGMFSIAGECVFDGLAHHDWSDVQLERLDHLLAGVDFLSVYRFAIRSEAAVSVANLDYFRDVRPTDMALMLEIVPSTSPSLAVFYTFLDEHWRGGYALWPRGWYDENKARVANAILNLADLADDRTQRVNIGALGELREKANQLGPLRAFWPGRVFVTAVAPERWNALREFSSLQVMVDEMRLACALERYRLKYQAYPAALTALIPQDLPMLPRDVITGRDYHYRLRPDGTYLLYSVGWNQRDDGGMIAYEPDRRNSNPKKIDYDHGDWVWPMPK